jgi:hypothetical protein
MANLTTHVPDPRDDGFATVAARRTAHRPIVALVADVLGDRGGRVLDLGCGSGALLEAITCAAPGVEPYGIEIDGGRAARARVRLSASGGAVFEGDLFALDDPWTGPRWAVALVMPGRLLEAPAEAAARLRTRLASRCDRAIAYAYGDWLTRFGGLDELAAVAGLALEPPDEGAGGYPLWRTCAQVLVAKR